MRRILLFQLVLGVTSLTAAPQAQTFRRPLVFEPNRGQAPAAVEWIARGPGYQLFLTSEGVTMVVREGTPEPPKQESIRGLLHAPAPPPASANPKYSTVRMKLTGSRPWNQVTGLEPTGAVSNYLLGNDAKAWRTNIPQYARISAAGVYDGIDLVFYSQGDNLEYDFVIAPGADPRQIRLAFEGQDRMHVDSKSGDLVVTTAGGSELRQIRPKVYQQLGDKRVEVAGGYELLDHGLAAFLLASYDRRRALVIDPVLIFNAALVGSQRNIASSIAVDASGNAYVTGWTDSADFVNQYPPALQKDQAGTDGFVAELSSSGKVQFITYLGGSGYDAGSGIAVDSTGVYITGTTDSTNFPHQSTKRNSDRDVFVTKLLPDGSGIVYTTIVGGSGADAGNAIAVDPVTHYAYVTGSTFSSNFPISLYILNRVQTDGGAGDVFIFFLDALGRLSTSVFLGGKSEDTGTGIALDHNGGVWVVGRTCSPDFPVLASPQPFPDPRYNPGVCPGFVAKLERFFSTLRTSQFLNGAKAVAVDANNNAFVTGDNMYGDNIVGAGPYLPLTKFDPSGAILARHNVASLRGKNRANAIAVNAVGEVYVAGYWGDQTPPEKSPGFIAKLSNDLQRIIWQGDVGSNGSSTVAIAVLDIAPTFVVSRIYLTATLFESPDSNIDPSLREVIVQRWDDNRTEPGLGFQRLRNYSVQNQYVNIESGVATASTIQPGWLSAEWNIIAQTRVAGDPPGQFVYWIQNRWKPDQYLNIESGFIQSTPIQPGWTSARWTFEPVSGSNSFQIHNVGQPDKYLNIVNGFLTAGPRVSGPQNTGGGAGVGRPSYYWGLEPVN